MGQAQGHISFLAELVTYMVMTKLTKEKREKTKVEIARSRQGLVMTGEDMMVPPSILGGSPSLLNIISKPALRSLGRCQCLDVSPSLRRPASPTVTQK